MAKDIYNLVKKREWSDKALSVLDEADRILINRYVDEKVANGISPLWAENLKCTLAKWRGWLPCPFDRLTKQDVFVGIKAMREENITKMDGRVKQYSQNHQHNLVKDLKAFLNWLIRNKIITGITLDEVKVDIKKPAQDFDVETSRDLITAEELLLLIKYSKGIRNKALIATVYETNGRIDEVRRLTWGDLTFEKVSDEEGSETWGANVLVHDKKEKKKKPLYLHDCVPYLMQWRNEYRGVPEGKALVFPSNQDGRGMHYGTLWKLLDDAARASGIAAAREKDGRHRLHWHLFRKSRITSMIKEGYKPSTVSKAAWGTTDSRMLTVYLKLADDEVIGDMKAHAGVKTGTAQAKKTAKARISTKCPRCKHENVADAEYCSKCSEPLTEAAKARRETEETEVWTKVLNKINERVAFLEAELERSKNKT